MSEVKRGIIETEPVGLDEIEGVCFDTFKHLTPLSFGQRISNFTYCGRPIKEYMSGGGKRCGKYDDVSDTCLVCQEGHRKHTGGGK